MKEKNQCVFIIGFPGALACEVADGLLSREDLELKLLVSPEHRKEADKYASRLKREISIVEGSEHKIDFGLGGGDYLALAQEITAVLQLSLPAPPGSSTAKPRALKAARETIELGLEATRLNHVIALSGLDVAGTGAGVFAEWDLEMGQGFADQFQEDRFRAERVFRRFTDKMPITIARAGWVAGAGRGLCPLIHLLLSLDDPASAQLKDPSGRIHAIDVKTLSDIIAGILETPPGKGGRTLNLAFADLPVLSELVPMISNRARELVPAGFELVPGAKRVLRRGERELFWSSREFLRKQPIKARISTSLTERFLGESGLGVPCFSDDILESLIARAVDELVGFR